MRVASYATQVFFEAHCAGFEDAEALERSGAGHPLAWTGVHEKYLALVDAELTKFCERRGVDENEVSAAIEAVLDARRAHLHHVLPIFLLTTEYPYFVRNMCETARMLRMRVAAEAADRSTSDDLTGVYVWHPPPRRAHEAWLKARGAPWAVRKIVLAAARKTEVVITHAPHAEYASAFAVPIFGRAEFRFALDGQRRPYSFGKDPNPQFHYAASQSATPTGDAITIRVEDERHRAPGAFYKVDTVERLPAGDLRHSQAFYEADGTRLGALEASLVRRTGK